MRYTFNWDYKTCRKDYIDYEYNDKGEVVITNVYIEKDYGFHSMLWGFLNNYGKKISDESLIKYKDIFIKDIDIISNINEIICFKKLNLKVIETYAKYLNIPKFLNETKTTDEQVYKIISEKSVVNYGGVSFSSLRYLKIQNIDFFDKYLKSLYMQEIKNWNSSDFWGFIDGNPSLNYNNFYKNYLNMFELKWLLLNKVDVPIAIIEEYVFFNMSKKGSKKDEELIKIIENYSNKFTEDFIIKNIKILSNFLDIYNLNLSIDILRKLEEYIGDKIFYCYVHNENIFPTNVTIDYINKYINIENYIESVKNNFEILSNGGKTKSKPYKISEDLIEHIDILIRYKYLSEDIKYGLKLMLETLETCVHIEDECKDIIKVGVNIKEVKQFTLDSYLNKIQETGLLFNKIKNNI